MTIQSNNITNQAGDGLPNLNGTSPVIKFQKKILGSQLNMSGNSTSGIADLGFSGLTIGKVYRYTLHPLIVHTGATSAAESVIIKIEHDGNLITGVTFRLDNSTTDNKSLEASGIGCFTATATTVSCTAVYNCTTASLQVPAANNASTYALIEELPYHAVTTDFT